MRFLRRRLVDSKVCCEYGIGTGNGHYGENRPKSNNMSLSWTEEDRDYGQGDYGRMGKNSSNRGRSNYRDNRNRDRGSRYWVVILFFLLHAGLVCRILSGPTQKFHKIYLD